MTSGARLQTPEAAGNADLTPSSPRPSRRLLFLVKLALYRFSSPSFAAHCPGTVHKVALLLHYLGTGAQDDAIAAAEDPWLPAPATALLRDVVGALNPVRAPPREGGRRCSDH